jgi:4-hydroxy-tetrahydrodipicolinate reductase
MTYVYDRQSKREKRDKKEIGIHAVRGGNIVGQHEVIFAGQDETITISHGAFSKDIFAQGALRAVLFIKDKPAGLYGMDDLL